MKLRNNYIAILIFIAVIFKFFIFSFAQLPIVSPDSTGYIFLAKLITGLDLHGYSGARTPGYPFIIAICNMNLKVVVAVQMALGVVITVVIFRLVYIYTVSQKIAFAAALTYLFYVPQFNIERSILSETSTTFCVTVSVYLAVLYYKKGRLFYLMILSVLFGCFASLIRPITVLLPFALLFLFIAEALFKNEKIITVYRKIIVLLIIIIPSITFWPYINYKNNQVFTASTLSGLGMTNAVGGFIIPRNDEFKIIRDIYLKYRLINVKEKGSYENTIFTAFDEMKQVTGLNYVSLSMQLKKMCNLEIKKQPLPYIKHVVTGTYRFWNPFAERDIKKGLLLLYLPSTITRVFIYALNVIFIVVLPLILLLSFNKMRIEISQLILYAVMYLFVLISSLAQAMVEFGTYRYSLPYQPVISCLAVIFAFHVFTDIFKIHGFVKSGILV